MGPILVNSIDSDDLIFTRLSVLEQASTELSSFSIVGRDKNYAILQKCRSDVTENKRGDKAVYLPSNFHSIMGASE